jgi:bifunctional DNA-binding transcriptional regulator/antitoxin component of YhaV-PrlF toxin-antitoxin module
MPFEPKVKLGKGYRVTIPIDMVHDLGWKTGDILRVGMDDKNNKLVIYRKVK